MTKIQLIIEVNLTPTNGVIPVTKAQQMAGLRTTTATGEQKAEISEAVQPIRIIEKYLLVHSGNNRGSEGASAMSLKTKVGVSKGTNAFTVMKRAIIGNSNQWHKELISARRWSQMMPRMKKMNTLERCFANGSSLKNVTITTANFFINIHKMRLSGGFLIDSESPAIILRGLEVVILAMAAFTSMGQMIAEVSGRAQKTNPKLLKDIQLTKGG
mmetsp:Transcript_23050/g.30100  ORF Transcript_23050/g.30100 Transcript_23050/m.30100 type:complete len:214 (+) Transcript_23050:56-697(+)